MQKGRKQIFFNSIFSASFSLLLKSWIILCPFWAGSWVRAVCSLPVAGLHCSTCAEPGRTGADGHSCTSTWNPKIQQSYPQNGVLCAGHSMHWLQYLAVKEYSCRCWCAVDQAFCWAAFKYTKYKCIITFQLNLFVGLAFDTMRNFNYGGPCKFYLEQFSLNP